MTRDELIAALDAATKPDRVLDFRIMKMAMPLRLTPIPRYTSSIDAALSLVPDGLRWRVAMVPVHTFASASISDGSILSPNTQEWEAHHTTPAIAICIAALKARP
jgi:hypothetical protein